MVLRPDKTLKLQQGCKLKKKKFVCVCVCVCVCVGGGGGRGVLSGFGDWDDDVVAGRLEDKVREVGGGNIKCTS